MYCLLLLYERTTNNTNLNYYGGSPLNLSFWDSVQVMDKINGAIYVCFLHRFTVCDVIYVDLISVLFLAVFPIYYKKCNKFRLAS